MNLTTSLVIWAVLFLFFWMVEALSARLFAAWFACGVIPAVIAAVLGAPFWAQALVWVVCSVLLAVLMRPVSRKFRERTREKARALRIVGRHGIVTETLTTDSFVGKIRIDDREWPAKANGIEPVPVGRRVTVRSLEGMSAIVRLSSEQPQEAESDEKKEEEARDA